MLNANFATKKTKFVRVESVNTNKRFLFSPKFDFQF